MNKNTDKLGQGQGHTPGPWRIVKTGNTRAIISCEGAPRTIASLDRQFPHLMDENENAANARLIAAAPELLDALLGLVVECEKLPDFHPTLRPSIALRHAIDKIEKATGQF